jgi:hypothetical protein
MEHSASSSLASQPRRCLHAEQRWHAGACQSRRHGRTTRCRIQRLQRSIRCGEAYMKKKPGETVPHGGTQRNVVCIGVGLNVWESFFFPICLFSFFSLFSLLFSVLLLISISVQIYTEFRFAHKQQSSSMYANMFLMYIVTLTTLFIYVDKCFKYAMHTLFIFKEIVILNL